MARTIELISPNAKGRLRLVSLAIVHVFLFAAAGYASFLLRFEFSIPPWQIEHLAYALCIWVVVKTLVFQLFAVNRATWRFISLPDARSLLAANVMASLASAVVIRLVAPHGFPARFICSTWRFACSLPAEFALPQECLPNLRSPPENPISVAPLSMAQELPA